MLDVTTANKMSQTIREKIAVLTDRAGTKVTKVLVIARAQKTARLQ